MAKTVKTGCTNAASLCIQPWQKEAQKMSKVVWQTIYKTTSVEAEEQYLL